MKKLRNIFGKIVNLKVITDIRLKFRKIRFINNLRKRINKRRMKFNWIIKDKLAASNIISSVSDIEFIKNQGINSVLCLVEESELYFESIEEYENILKKYNIELKHIPIKDFNAPTLNQIIEAVKWIEFNIKNNKKVLVHCFGGLGRTGTIISSFLVYYKRISADEAIEFVRLLRPGSVESFSQVQAVRKFESYLKSNNFKI